VNRKYQVQKGRINEKAMQGMRRTSMFSDLPSERPDLPNARCR